MDTELHDPCTRRAALRATAAARLERLHEIRFVEEKIQDFFADGSVRGSTHTSQGQEAVAVALAEALDATDTVTCTYRGHHHALALGVPPESVLAEILGRSTGSVRGLGGSMHLCAPEVGLLPTFAIVGAGLPVAVGAALTAEVTASGAVSAAVFGDGAANIGAFHESLNLAAVWKLPVLFLCENNLYAEYSPLAATTAVEHIADRAHAYGMDATIVDGQDLETLRHELGEIVANIRETRRPHLVEIKTYRFVGHSRADPATYRAPGELEEWMERDPLSLYAIHVVKAGELSDAEVELAISEARAAVALAAERALAAPAPDVAEMFRHVLGATDP